MRILLGQTVVLRAQTNRSKGCTGLSLVLLSETTYPSPGGLLLVSVVNLQHEFPFLRVDLSPVFSKVNAEHEFNDGDCDTTLYYHGFQWERLKMRALVSASCLMQ